MAEPPTCPHSGKFPLSFLAQPSGVAQCTCTVPQSAEHFTWPSSVPVKVPHSIHGNRLQNTPFSFTVRKANLPPTEKILRSSVVFPGLGPAPPTVTAHTRPAYTPFSPGSSATQPLTLLAVHKLPFKNLGSASLVPTGLAFPLCSNVTWPRQPSHSVAEFPVPPTLDLSPCSLLMILRFIY